VRCYMHMRALRVRVDLRVWSQAPRPCKCCVCTQTHIPKQARTCMPTLHAHVHERARVTCV